MSDGTINDICNDESDAHINEIPYQFYQCIQDRIVTKCMNSRRYVPQTKLKRGKQEVWVRGQLDPLLQSIKDSRHLLLANYCAFCTEHNTLPSGEPFIFCLAAVFTP